MILLIHQVKYAPSGIPPALRQPQRAESRVFLSERVPALPRALPPASGSRRVILSHIAFWRRNCDAFVKLCADRPSGARVVKIPGRCAGFSAAASLFSDIPGACAGISKAWIPLRFIMNAEGTVRRSGAPFHTPPPSVPGGCAGSSAEALRARQSEGTLRATSEGEKA